MTSNPRLFLEHLTLSAFEHVLKVEHRDFLGFKAPRQSEARCIPFCLKSVTFWQELKRKKVTEIETKTRHGAALRTRCGRTAASLRREAGSSALTLGQPVTEASGRRRFSARTNRAPRRNFVNNSSHAALNSPALFTTSVYDRVKAFRAKSHRKR